MAGQLVYTYLDSGLNSVQETAYLDHVEKCWDCAIDLEELRQVLAVLHSTADDTPPVPSGLPRRIKQAVIEAQQDEQVRPARRTPPIGSPAFVATCASLLIGAVMAYVVTTQVYLGGHGDAPDPRPPAIARGTAHAVPGQDELSHDDGAHAPRVLTLAGPEEADSAGGPADRRDGDEAQAVTEVEEAGSQAPAPAAAATRRAPRPAARLPASPPPPPARAREATPLRASVPKADDPASTDMMAGTEARADAGESDGQAPGPPVRSGLTQTARTPAGGRVAARGSDDPTAEDSAAPTGMVTNPHEPRPDLEKVSAPPDQPHPAG